MCRVCEKNFPTAAEYKYLRSEAKGLLGKWSKTGNAAVNPQFIKDVVKLDSFRLTSGAGWGNPGHRGKPIGLIFRNPDPNKGLLLYIICNVMDYQMRTERVWSDLLVEANGWIGSYSRKAPPRKGMPGLNAHLVKIVSTTIRSGSISNWFASKIVSIASNNPTGHGNIYRIVGSMFLELLNPPKTKQCKQGKLLMNGKCALLGDWKRLWIIVRGLRRDNSLIRCLFERALSTAAAGQKAIQYWYDENYFDPKECELPVDKWVKDRWIEIMKSSSNLKRKGVAEGAKHLAFGHNVSPSIFDVLFIAR